jgi:hypothetical protein
MSLASTLERTDVATDDAETVLPEDSLWLLDTGNVQACVYALLLIATGKDLTSRQSDLDLMFDPGFSRSGKPTSGFRRRVINCAVRREHADFPTYGIAGGKIEAKVTDAIERSRRAHYVCVTVPAFGTQMIEVALRTGRIEIKRI